MHFSHLSTGTNYIIKKFIRRLNQLLAEPMMRFTLTANLRLKLPRVRIDEISFETLPLLT